MHFLSFSPQMYIDTICFNVLMFVCVALLCALLRSHLMDERIIEANAEGKRHAVAITEAWAPQSKGE